MKKHKISQAHILLTIIFSLLFVVEVSFAVNNTTNNNTQNVSIAPITAYLLNNNTCSATGDWVVKLDWYCDGNYDYGNVTFKKDGTFIAYDNQDEYEGAWSEHDKSIKWDFNNHLVSYQGTINSTCNAMRGKMRASNGATGCWSALKQSKTNSATKKSDKTIRGKVIESNISKSSQNPWFPFAD